MKYDIIIKNGVVFDGSDNPGVAKNLGIQDGKIVSISDTSLNEEGCSEVIDASGKWVTPGFLEIHSHYDAEVIAAPALKESVRHGVTTVAIGSCSISAIVSSAEDCSDLFTRVEAVPRELVLPIFEAKKTWSNPEDYRKFFDQHPMGPNLCSFIGHSDIRIAAMGLERATTRVKPTKEEMKKMEDYLHQALDAGLMGISVMTTRLDKMDGERERAWSRSLPSTYAGWGEFRKLFSILRKRNGILQGAPDAVGKINIFAFFWESMGWFRKNLRITLLTAMDLKSQPLLQLMVRISGTFANYCLRANFRWQFLTKPFQLQVDGLDFGNFEEFATGELLRDCKSHEEQLTLMRDPSYREEFKLELKAFWSVGLWNRDFSDCFIIECPDESIIGKNFAEIGKMQGKDPVDAFFDLAIQYSNALRWKTVLANTRPEIMHKMMKSKALHVGFADSGAHIRSLANYNFPLCFLKYARDAELEGIKVMDTGAAVHRLTGELADWFGLDTGYIRKGAQADVVVINPEGLNYTLEEVKESEMEGFGIIRLVNRNDDAVEATVINGRIAYRRSKGFAADLGTSKNYGRFIRCDHLST